MHVVRDLLDKAIVDRHGRPMGRADRVIAELREGAPPRVVAIEVGAPALGERLSPAIGRAAAGFLHALDVDDGQPLRIHVSEILGVTEQIKVDLALGETPAANVERKLRGFVGALPGAQR